MRKTRHRVLTPQDENGIEAATLARFGASNRYIREATGLTDGRVTYALTKAKHILKYKPGETLRSGWRDGTSDLFQAMLHAARSEVRKEIVQDVCLPIAKPELELSPKGRR